MRMIVRMGKTPSRRSGRPTNLYLSAAVKDEATKIAHERYHLSLSELVERLLTRELGLKRGLLNKRAE